MDEKAKELFQKNWGDTSMVYAGDSTILNLCRIDSFDM